MTASRWADRLLQARTHVRAREPCKGWRVRVRFFRTPPTAAAKQRRWMYRNPQTGLRHGFDMCAPSRWCGLTDRNMSWCAGEPVSAGRCLRLLRRLGLALLLASLRDGPWVICEPSRETGILLKHLAQPLAYKVGKITSSRVGDIALQIFVEIFLQSNIHGSLLRRLRRRWYERFRHWSSMSGIYLKASSSRKYVMVNPKGLMGTN